ncbi:DEKNAAC100011 [Brettanomyces naardenensis]|uniref:V-type proton ATPase subunit G n=1 Tax=Brettanomyces naardenensis TaxID=13370 RepID=A0A448YED6_BRENA|nr:DEKNAAC100011 [Brettanomyces naardenensis]
MSGGIQSLLKTEKDAQEIVSQARRYRTQKLKAAKLDAKAEIDAYKAKKAEELKKFEDEFVGANKKAEEEADKQVQGELEGIKKTAASKEAAVVKLLVDAVGTPSPELPTNVSKVEAH